VWHFDFTFNTASAAETSLFFTTNFFHDFLYDLGFDEASGNFQEDNFGRGGSGSDSINANARAPGRNNANFATPSDGSNPTMNMFLWNGAGCWQANLDGNAANGNDNDGTIDQDIVYHEIHHGLTYRLNTAWSGTEAGAMGEGGGDFFAYSINDDTKLAEYSAPPNGIRQVNANTYSNWCPACGVHTNGQIWANTLWDLRERFRMDLVEGSQAAGINELHQLYINGLKLSPASPTMLELRDSMLQDDLIRNPSAAPGGSENYCRMWAEFAGRGMGVSAQDTKDTGNNTVVANFTEPAACTGPPPTPPNPAPSGLTATASGSSQINLSWTDGGSVVNEDGHRVLRCTPAPCTPTTQIAELSANSTFYSDTTVLAMTSYTYLVRAFNAGGTAESNTASATTPNGPPAAPSNLRTTATGKTSITQAWDDNATNELNFVLERSSGSTCTGFTPLVTLAANTTTYTNTGLPRRTTRCYRIRAWNLQGYSAYSNTNTATTK